MTKTNLYLGLVCIAVALLLMFLWIPLDTETGLVEKARRRLTIGDALAPTVAAAFLLVGGLMVMVFERTADEQPHMTQRSLMFLISTVAILVTATLVMRYAGPLTVGIANLGSAEALEYRLLRDTTPWKHIGYLIGGSLMITALITLLERRFTWRGLIIAVVSTLVLIAIYDLPFNDILLPPNGDV